MSLCESDILADGEVRCVCQKSEVRCRRAFHEKKIGRLKQILD